MLTGDAPIDLTYVDNQRRVVLNAIANGGGWVQIFWHRLCPDDCDEYSWPPAWLHEFLTWLEQQRAAGTVDVKSSQEVLGLPFHPAVAPAAAPKPPKGANRLRNAALVRAKGADAPRCWEHRGGGEWQRAGGESVPIGGAPDGFAALAVPQDQGGCAPAVKAGERLTARATYRSADRPRLLVWARSKAGGWSFWRDGPRLPVSHGFRKAALKLPRVPRGVTALSVGVALSGDGRLAVRHVAWSGALDFKCT